MQEDVCYSLFFDPRTEMLRELTQEQTKGLDFWVNLATNKRKADRKTDVVVYQSTVSWTQEEHSARSNNNKDLSRAG